MKVITKYPFGKNSGDAGYDLYSTADLHLGAQQRVTVPTGLFLEIPDGIVGLVWPRSGMSVKKGVDVLAGVIDSSYRGEIMVCLYNTSHDGIEIKAGDRIAQILFQPIYHLDIQISNELSDTERGSNGFASSGW